jgi:hypothetical protein
LIAVAIPSTSLVLSFIALPLSWLLLRSSPIVPHARASVNYG